MASRDLKDASPKVSAVFLAVKAIFEKRFPAYELRPTCTYRSPLEQKAAFDAGNSQIDGITKKGQHNYRPSHAIDIGIFRRSDGAYLDDLLAKAQCPRALYDALFWVVGLLAQHNGARWGGDWDGDGIPVPVDPTEHFNDHYHIEVPE